MLPWLAREVVYPLQELACRRPTFAYLRDIERSQWLAPSQLAALQRQRLNALLRAALEHSPWHASRLRAAGLAPAIAQGAVAVDDLAMLPTMSKSDARQHVDALVWRGVPGGVYRSNTGGSSGEPLVFYVGRARQAADAAARMRARRWWGVEPGEPEVYLWGAPIELSRTDHIKSLRDRMLNQLVLNAFAMSAARMDDYLEAIAGFRPHCIYGYASSLSLLAAHASARGRRPRLPALRVVCTTGEPLYPHQRELLEATFGVPVANEYGCRDGGFLGHEAPGAQMLGVAEFNLFEVLDREGRPVAPGTPGELVLTGLVSQAQPFIRYRTGDVITFAAAPAAQGRGLPVIADVSGRSTDFVVSEDGTVMHALAVIYVLRALEGVAQFKCIQHTPLDMEVQVVRGERWVEADAARIAEGLRARLGARLRIDLRLLDAIPPEKSGKYRYVVSHVAVPGPAGAMTQSAACG